MYGKEFKYKAQKSLGTSSTATKCNVMKGRGKKKGNRTDEGIR